MQRKPRDFRGGDIESDLSKSLSFEDAIPFEDAIEYLEFVQDEIQQKLLNANSTSETNQDESQQNESKQDESKRGKDIELILSYLIIDGKPNFKKLKDREHLTEEQKKAFTEEVYKTLAMSKKMTIPEAISLLREIANAERIQGDLKDVENLNLFLDKEGHPNLDLIVPREDIIYDQFVELIGKAKASVDRFKEKQQKKLDYYNTVIEDLSEIRDDESGARFALPAFKQTYEEFLLLNSKLGTFTPKQRERRATLSGQLIEMLEYLYETLAKFDEYSHPKKSIEVQLLRNIVRGLPEESKKFAMLRNKIKSIKEELQLYTIADLCNKEFANAMIELNRIAKNPKKFAALGAKYFDEYGTITVLPHFLVKLSEDGSRLEMRFHNQHKNFKDAAQKAYIAVKEYKLSMVAGWIKELQQKLEEISTPPYAHLSKADIEWVHTQTKQIIGSFSFDQTESAAFLNKIARQMSEIAAKHAGHHDYQILMQGIVNAYQDYQNNANIKTSLTILSDAVGQVKIRNEVPGGQRLFDPSDHKSIANAVLPLCSEIKGMLNKLDPSDPSLSRSQ